MTISRQFPAAIAVFLILLPFVANSDVTTRTSEASESGTVRITSPEDGASLPAGEPLKVEFVAALGFKGRHVQLQLDEREPVVLDNREGSHSFSDLGPGEHTVRVALLNRAHVDLGVEDSITVTITNP